MATVLKPRAKSVYPVPEPDLTPDEIIARATALIPRLRAEQDEAEQRGGYTEGMHQGFMVNAILKERLEVHCDFLRRPKIIGWIIRREAQWVLGFGLRLRCLRFCHHSAL